MAETVKSYQIGNAPKQIKLFGDKKRKPESSAHIIEFPGGAIELSRTSDGNYWAHIIANRDHTVDDCEGLVSAFGEIVGSRIDYEFPHDPIEEIPNASAVRQIAI